jgi:PAS domain S-box-containing protein
MNQHEQKIPLIYYLTTCIILVYTIIPFVSGMAASGMIMLLALLLALVAIYTELKIKFNNSKVLLYAAAMLTLFVNDSHLDFNTGFAFFYVLLAIAAAKQFKQIKNSLIFAFLGVPAAIFLMVNNTTLTPQLGSAINEYYHTNFTLYFNFFAALLTSTVLVQSTNQPKQTTNNTDYDKQLTDAFINYAAASKNIIWVLDPLYNIVFTNTPYQLRGNSLTGCNAKVGQNIINAYTNDNKLEFWKEQYDEALMGNTVQSYCETIVNGQKFKYDVAVVPFKINNKVVFICATATQQFQELNTENITAETADITSKDRTIDLLVNATDDIIFEFNEKDLCTKIWYAKTTKLLYPESYFYNKTIAQLFDEPFKTNLHQLAKEVKNTNIEKHIEYSFKLNGDLKHYAACVKPSADKNKVHIVVKDITEEKNLIKIHRKQNEFLNTLIDNIPVGIFVKEVKNGLKYSIWNKEMERLFGFSAKDAIGKNDFDLFATINDIEAYAQTDQMVIESKEPLLINQLNLNTEIGQLIVRNIKYPLLDKHGEVEQIIGIIENITEVTRAQQELTESEARWSFALSGSRVAVWDINLNNNQVYFSPVFKQMLGYEEAENPNLILNHIIHPDDADKVNQKLLEHLNGISDFYEAEYRIKKKDGTYIWVLDRGKVCNVDNEGNAIRITGTFSDITYRKQLEEQLITAKENAESASKAKSLFLSTLSHEIRTPMNAVTGIVNLLVDKHTPEQEELIKTLKFSADNLMYLLNDILDFNKIDAGKLELEHIEFNMNQLVQNITDTFKVKTAEKNLAITCNLDKQLPHTLIGDPVRLGQVLTNLISNAVKFTQEGNILIEVILRNKTEHEVSIEIAVSDTGIGIEQDKLQIIFESFNQAHPGTTRTYGGTGLGLAISKKLVELFGSKIYVTSKQGVGSKFWFTLKLPYINKIVVEPKPGETKDPVKITLDGMRVLIAEDNRLNTFVISQFLKTWNVSFDIAVNGIEAVALAKTNKYDLVLMDLQMPLMDGLTAAKEIRKFNTYTPIFALTANAISDAKDEVFKAGMNDFITKPFVPEELLKKMVKIYQQQKKQPINFKLFN